MLKIRGPALDQYGAAQSLIHDASRKAARQARADLLTGKLTQSDYADRRRRQREALDQRLNSIKTYWAHRSQGGSNADFRTHHECTCPPGICRAQPQPAPIHHPSKSFTLQAIAFWVVMALIAGGTWQALEYGEHQYQTDRRR